jgi:hypothetical protein
MTVVVVAALSPAWFEFAVMIKRGKANQGEARSRRLSAALRENLKRRKAQERGRAGSEPVSVDSADKDTAGKDSLAKDAKMGSDVPDFRRNRGRD